MNAMNAVQFEINRRKLETAVNVEITNRMFLASAQGCINHLKHLMQVNGWTDAYGHYQANNGEWVRVEIAPCPIYGTKYTITSRNHKPSFAWQEGLAAFRLVGHLAK